MGYKRIAFFRGRGRDGPYDVWIPGAQGLGSTRWVSSPLRTGWLPEELRGTGKRFLPYSSGTTYAISETPDGYPMAALKGTSSDRASHRKACGKHILLSVANDPSNKDINYHT